MLEWCWMWHKVVPLVRCSSWLNRWWVVALEVHACAPCIQTRPTTFTTSPGATTKKLGSFPLPDGAVMCQNAPVPYPTGALNGAVRGQGAAEIRRRRSHRVRHGRFGTHADFRLNWRPQLASRGAAWGLPQPLLGNVAPTVHRYLAHTSDVSGEPM